MAKNAINEDLSTGGGSKKLGDFRFFLIFYCMFGVFGVYMIPNWLIKVPGHFGILFR